MPTADEKRDFTLAALRRAVASVRLTALEIEEIGIALGHGMIDAEGAVTWLDTVGLGGVIDTPWPTRMVTDSSLAKEPKP